MNDGILARMPWRPLEWSFYVFWSKGAEPTGREQGSGVYLIERGDARYLQAFFDPLYDSAGIGISTSDDEEISGKEPLAALAAAVRQAIEDVRGQPDEWPVITGYRFEPFQQKPGPAIVEAASRARLLDFLGQVAEIIRRAEAAGGTVHFGGGG